MRYLIFLQANLMPNSQRLQEHNSLLTHSFPGVFLTLLKKLAALVLSGLKPLGGASWFLTRENASAHLFNIASSTFNGVILLFYTY